MMRTTAVHALFFCCCLVFLSTVHCHRPHDAVTSMAVSRDGRTLFAIIRRFLLRSVDSGRTWRWSAFGLYLHPFDQSDNTRVFLSPGTETVYVHAANGVSKSVDGGNVWVLQPGSPVSLHGFDNLVFSPDSESTIAVAGRVSASNVTDVFLSRDAGVTYERLHCPVQGGIPSMMLWIREMGLLLVSDSATHSIYAHNKTWGLLTTLNFVATHAVETESAQNVSRVLFGGPTGVVHLTLCRNSSHDVHVCGHTSYTHAISGLANPNGDGFAVGSHRGPPGSETLYILPPYALFFLHSTDGGVNWQRLDHTHGVQSTHDAQEGSSSFSAVFGVTGLSRVYLAAYWGLHVSVDSGATWGAVNTLNALFTTVSPACADEACSSWMLSACTYAAECYNVLVNTSHHTSSARILFRDDEPNAGYVTPALSPAYHADGIELRAYGASVFRATGVRGRFSKSIAQLAVTFTPFPRDTTAYIHVLQMSPGFGVSDGAVFVSGCNLGAYGWHTADYGVSWGRVGGVRSGCWRLMVSDNFTTDGTMAVGKADGSDQSIWWSTDRGQNWTQITGSWAVGTWYEHRVFRGTHGTFPVVVGLRLVSGAQKLPFVTRDGAWTRLLPTELHDPLRPFGFSEYTMVLAPTGSAATRRVYLGYLWGGGRSMLVADNGTLLQVVDALPTPAQPHTRPGWSHANMGALANTFRPTQQKVAVSPRFVEDGVMFATAYQDIMLSRDRGVTWQTVLTLPNTLASSECAPGCAYCKSFDPRAGSCLECSARFQRAGTSRGATSNPGSAWNFVCEPDASQTLTSTTATTTSPPTSTETTTFTETTTATSPLTSTETTTFTETATTTSPLTSTETTTFTETTTTTSPPTSTETTTTPPGTPPPPPIAGGSPRDPRPPPSPSLSLPPTPPPPQVSTPSTPLPSFSLDIYSQSAGSRETCAVHMVLVVAWLMGCISVI